MEDKKHIIFQKERTTSEIFKDAFDFFKINYKDILKKNLKIIAPFFLVMLISFMISSYHTRNYMFTGTGFGSYFISYMLQQLFILLFITITQAGILVYIKAYTNNIEYGEYGKNSFTKEVYKVFIPLLILNFVTIFLSVLASFVFIFPGIYLIVVFLLSPVILVFQNKKPYETVSYSFDFIKQKWGNVFKTFILLVLILIVFSLLNTFVYYLYSAFRSLFTESGDSMYGVNKFNDPFLFIVYILSFVIYLFLYIYAVIVYAMTYFNIIESRSHTGLISEIDKIGENIEI